MYFAFPSSVDLSMSFLTRTSSLTEMCCCAPREAPRREVLAALLCSVLGKTGRDNKKVALGGANNKIEEVCFLFFSWVA